MPSPSAERYGLVFFLELNMPIRELRFCDIPHCVELVRQNWGDSVAERTLVEMKHAFLPDLKCPPIYHIFEHNGQIVAFAGMVESWIMRGVWQFIWINVRLDYQRQDIGTMLTRFRIDEVRDRGGKVIHLMTQKPGFFNRFGFKTLSVYDTPEGDDSLWVLMDHQLEPLALN